MDGSVWTLVDEDGNIVSIVPGIDLGDRADASSIMNALGSRSATRISGMIFRVRRELRLGYYSESILI